ncbi:MAG: isoamylase early set domain-containing protein, partial [bacterium]
MNELDPRLEPWLAALRKEPAARPEARARLAAALREEETRAARRILSPPAALAAAVALIALTSAFWLALWRWNTPERGTAVEELTMMQFVLHAHDARSVSVVGDFNDWDPRATPLTRTGDGVWSAVVRLRPGTVRYAYLVDGTEWRADPHAVASRE